MGRRARAALFGLPLLLLLAPCGGLSPTGRSRARRQAGATPRSTLAPPTEDDYERCELEDGAYKQRKVGGTRWQHFCKHDRRRTKCPECCNPQESCHAPSFTATNAKSWDRFFNQLVAFMEAEGHTCVPQTYLSADGYPLGQRVNRVRSRGDFVRQHPERRALLDALDFVWDANEQARARFRQALHAFVAERGHARVPCNYVSPDGYRLGKQVTDVRARGSHVGNDEALLAELEELGFVWNEHDAKWLDFLGHLRAYVAEHGHARVPTRLVIEPDEFRLGQSVADVRSKGMYCAEGAVEDAASRLEMLLEMGFCWHGSDQAESQRRAEYHRAAVSEGRGWERVPQIETEFAALLAKEAQEPAAGTTVRLNEFSDGFLTVRVALSFSHGEAATDAPATAALSCPDGAPGGEWLCVRLNGTLLGCLPYENRGQDDIEAEKEVTVGVPREQLRVGRSWIMLQVVRTTTDEARADFEAGRFDLDSGGVASSSASGVVVTASMRPSYVDVVGGAHGDGGDGGGSHGGDNGEREATAVTAVLTLTLTDLTQASVLLGSLQAMVRHGQAPGAGEGGQTWLRELIVVVPDHQTFAFEGLFGNGGSGSGSGSGGGSGDSLRYAYPIRVLSEKRLLTIFDPRWDKYALAMSLKLLVAAEVRTPYYMTLDADVIATRPLATRHFFSADGRAIYVDEPQSAHPHWWQGSANTLLMPLPEQATFGVTPALLSTPGSLMVLARLRALSRMYVFEDEGEVTASNELDEGAVDELTGWERTWLGLWGEGRWWSEYTLYSIVLHEHALFDELHVKRDADAEAEAEIEAMPALYGHADVWWEGDLPWDAAAAFADSDCSFAIVQSSSGVDVPTLAGQVAAELRQIEEGN